MYAQLNSLINEAKKNKGHNMKKTLRLNRQQTLQKVIQNLPTVFKPAIPDLLVHAGNDLKISISNGLQVQFNNSTKG